MPQALVPVVASLLGGGVIAGAVAQLLVGVAFSALSQALMRPDGVTARRPGIRTEFPGSGDVTPQSIILGRYATPGHKMAPAYTHSRRSTDDAERMAPDTFYGGVGSGKILTMVRSLSDAPLAGLAAIYVDGVRFNYPADFEPREKYGMGPKAGLSEDKAKYRDTLSVEFFNGTQAEPSAYLRGAYGEHPKRPWGPNAVHRGGAYVVVSFDLDYDLFKSEPKLLFVVDGMPLLDPRTGVVGPTNNPAVMAWHVYQTIPFGPDRFGVGLPRAYLPDTVWRTAMNVCDLQVPNGAGGTEPQYRAGYEIKVAQPEMGGDEPLDIIDVLLRSMAGQVAEIGGDIHIRAGAPGLPVVAMTDDDILASEAEAHSPIVGISGIFNSVAAQYPSPADAWATRDAKTITDAVAVARLGEVRQGGVDLSAVPYRNQVNRLMRAWLDDAQKHRAHTFTLPARWASKMLPLAVFAWTSQAYAYESKLFEVQEAVHDVTNGQVAVVVREIDPNDWSVGNAELGPDREVTPPKTFIEPFDLGTIQLFPAIAVDANGVARRPGIRATWDAEGRNLGSVTVEYRLRGLTVATITDTTADGPAGYLTTFDGILPATEYEGRAKGIVRGSSVWTDWVPVTTPDVGLTENDLSVRIRNALQDAEDQRDLLLIGFVQSEEANEKADNIVAEVLEPALVQLKAEVASTIIEVAAGQLILDEAGVLIDGKVADLRAEIAAADSVVISRIEALNALVESVGTTGGDGTFALAARVDTVEVEIGEAKASVVQEAAARVSATEALAVQIDTISASVGDVDSRVTSQSVAFADETMALAQRIDALVVTKGDGTGTVEDESIARADADMALAARITTVTATMADNKAQAQSQLNALTTKDLALASQITSLTASIGNVDARVTSQSVARADADKALAFRIDSVTAAVGAASASFTQEITARATADAALTVAIQSIRAQANDFTAAINRSEVTFANQDVAIAKLRTDLTATTSKANASITKSDQVVATVDGFASAYSGITVQTSGGGVAGFKATSFTNPDGTGGATLDLLGDAIRAGTILLDRLVVGQGRNRLEDSDFSQGARNWRIGRTGTIGDQSVLAVVQPGQPYGGLADPTMSLRQYGSGTTGSAFAFAMGVNPDTQALTDLAVACDAGDVFFASARMLPVACTAFIGLRFFDGNGNELSAGKIPVPTSAAEPNRPPRRWQRRQIRATAPPGSAFVQMFFEKDTRSSGSVSALYWYQPQLEETHNRASEPTPYGRSGVTLIDGGQLVTRTVFAEAINVASFQAAGLAIFGGGLQSEDFTAGRSGRGWQIRDNGDATFGTLQLRQGSVTSAVVADLQNGGAASINCGAGGTLLILALVRAEFSDTSDGEWSGSITVNGVSRLGFSGYSRRPAGENDTSDFRVRDINTFRLLEIPTGAGGVFTVRATINQIGFVQSKSIQVLLLENKR